MCGADMQLRTVLYKTVLFYLYFNSMNGSHKNARILSWPCHIYLTWLIV